MRIPKRLVTNAVFRIAFGVALVASVTFRFNFFSLVYLAFLLWLPLLSAPSDRNMKGLTGTYMKIVIVTSSTICTAQLIFLLMIMAGSETTSSLTFCSTKESILRHLGLTMLHESRTTVADAIRLILPDVITLTASISAYTFCKRYQVPKRRAISRTQSALSNFNNKSFQDTVHYFSVIFSLCVAGICYPSLSSALYFTAFMFFTSWWSAKQEVGSWFSYVTLILMAACGAHIVLLFLFQMHFIHHYSNPSNLMARLFGMSALVRTSCGRPYTLELYERVNWTHILNPFCLYFCYSVLAVRSRYWFFRSKLQERMMLKIEKIATEELEKKAQMQTLIRKTPGRKANNCYSLSFAESDDDQMRGTLVTNTSTIAPHITSISAGALTEPLPNGKLSVGLPPLSASKQESTLGISSVHTLGSGNAQTHMHRAGGAQMNIRRKASGSVPFGVSTSQSHSGGGGGGATAKKSTCGTVTGTGSTGATSDSRSSWLRGGGIYQLIQKMFQFMVKRSCTCAPMVMMVWGITYHNWMTFVLLIWASGIWMWPNSRQATLTTSFLLVTYGNVLLILQYIYSLDLTIEEMPRASQWSRVDDGSFDLKQVGLVEYKYPVRHLALQVIYCFFFWGTFRHFMRKRERKLTIARLTTAPLPSAATTSGVLYQGLGPQYSQPLSSIFHKGPFPVSSTSPTAGALAIQSAIVLNTNRPHMADSHNEVIARFYDKIHRVFTKYWVVMCVAMFLIVSLEDDNVVAYKIIYMILFLAFVALYGISFSVWRRAMAGFWWVTVVYSILVLVTIYTYQFKAFPTYWKRVTHLDDAELKALGLEQHNTSGLFTKLLTPTLFVLVCNIQLHYFHVPLLQMTRITNEGTPNPRRKVGTNENPQIQKSTKERSENANRSSAWYESEWFFNLQKYWSTVGSFWWRFLELHMIKFLCFMGMLVAIRDLCAANFLLVLYIALCLPYPRLRGVLTSLMAVSCSLMVLARMIYQLSYIDEKAFQRRCNNTVGLKQAAIDEETNKTLNQAIWGSWGRPFQNMSDSAQWAGLNKITDINKSLSSYVWDHVILLLMILVDATVLYHQTFLEKIKRSKPLPRGVLIAGVTRKEADKDIQHMIKYFINYGFYKFGLEICYVVTVVVICVRLDVVSIIHWVWLLFLIFLPRRFVHHIWPFYVISLSVMLPAQYLMCLGFPPSLCHKYPWFNSAMKYNLSVWLYLPNYVDPPNKWFLMGDFIQFLVVSMQWLVFEEERNVKEPLDGGGDNTDVNSVDAGVAGGGAGGENQVPDFMMNRNCLLDTIKVIIFNYLYWFTYAIVFLAGTSRVSILCLGYVCFSFMFFWQGQDLLIKARKHLLHNWNKLLLYNMIVIVLKNCFQIVGCVYFHELLGHCWILQSFSIVCVRNLTFSSADNKMGNCELPTDQAGLSMDCFCFATILLQRKIFQSNYFHYVYLELREQTSQASRGAYLINTNLRKEIKKRHQEEQQTVDKIRRSMIRIRLRQRGMNQQWVPETHNQAIFTGYLQFDGRKEDESESDSELDEFHDALQSLKSKTTSPGAFDYAYGALIAGADVALKRHSIQSTFSSQFGSAHYSISAISNQVAAAGGAAGGKRHRSKGSSRPSSFHSMSRDHTLEDLSDFNQTSKDEITKKLDYQITRQSSCHIYRKSSRPLSLNLARSLNAGVGVEDMILEDRESPTSDYNTCYGESEDTHILGTLTPSTTFPTTILETEELAVVEEEVEQDLIDLEQASNPRAESVPKTMFNWGRLMSIIFLKSIDNFLDWLFSLSKDYRYVAYILKCERKKAREKIILLNLHASIDPRDSSDSVKKSQRFLSLPQSGSSAPMDPNVSFSNENIQKSNSRKGLYLNFRPSNEPVQSDTAEEFSDFDLGRNLQNASRSKKLMFACYYATIAHSELICYFIIVFNQLLSASILAMPLPIMVFLWAMLSVPRPTKRFWVTAITYTEIVVVVKYLFQFQFYSWNSEEVSAANVEDPFWWPRIVGIEKKPAYAHCDLALLLALFFHRSILKMHGLWRDENSSMMMKQSEQACQVAPPSRTPCSTSTQQQQQSQQQAPPDPLAKFVYTDPQGNVLRPSEIEVPPSGKISKINSIALPCPSSMRQSVSQPDSFQSVLDQSDFSMGAMSFQTGPVTSSIADLSQWVNQSSYTEADQPITTTNQSTVQESLRRDSSSSNHREDGHSFAPEHSLSASEARVSSSREQSPHMMETRMEPIVTSSTNDLCRGGDVIGYYADSDGEGREPGMDITPPPEAELKSRRKISVIKEKVSNMGIRSKFDYTRKRLEDLFRPVQKFYAHLIDPSMSASLDVYALMFFFDFITYLILIFNWWAFSDIGTNQNVTKYIEEDRIPSMFLAMLLVQFVLTIIDRAIYLRKFVLGKFVFQIVQVIWVHTWVFFIIPKTTKKKFTDNLPVQMWYFFRSIYFGLSAVQIKCGYPTRILGNFLAKRYSIINLVFFKMFRTLPFLLELRALMDWMWTDSSLMLFHWVRLEDIYASVFSIKCNRKFSQDFPYKRGAKRSIIMKYGVGGFLLITLILIIWFPLLFMSLVYTASEKNPPIEASVEISIGAFQPIFKASTQQNLAQFTRGQYNQLLEEYQSDPKARAMIKQYQYEDLVEVTLNGNSTQLWGASPPSRDELINTLKDSQKDIHMRFEWYLTRLTIGAQKVSETSSGFNLIKLNGTMRDQLAGLLTGENSNGAHAPVLIRNLFPKYIRVPSAGASVAINDLGDTTMSNQGRYATVSVDLMSSSSKALGMTSSDLGRDMGMEWWVLREVEKVHNDGSGYDSKDYLKIITFNERVFPQSVSYLAGYGIIGLYLSLVLVIGKFVRMFVSGISYKIPFDELPNVDKVLKLCLDIYLCREVKEFSLEEDLFAKLMYIYRSPEMLVRFTKLKLQ